MCNISDKNQLYQMIFIRFEIVSYFLKLHLIISLSLSQNKTIHTRQETQAALAKRWKNDGFGRFVIYYDQSLRDIELSSGSK